MARPRLYEQLVEQILAYIESAQLGPGDLLPAERDLAERLGVSRATLAQALVALEVLGVIDVQHGTGAVLVYRPSVAVGHQGPARAPAAGCRRSWRPAARWRSSSPRWRPSGERTRTSRRSTARWTSWRRKSAAGTAATHGDELFHQAVTAAAHSSVLGQLMAFIAEMILETRIESLGQPGRPEQSLASHRKIADAIRAAGP